MKAHVKLESKMEIRIKHFFSISMEFNPVIAYINEDGDEDFTAACERLYHYNYDNDNDISLDSQEADYLADFQVTAKGGRAKVRAEVNAAELCFEWNQYVEMKGTSIYQILKNAMFQCLKATKKHLESEGSDPSIEILFHPLTCGLFYYYTFRRIVVSSWAENHITQSSKVIYSTNTGEQVTIIFDATLPALNNFCAYMKETDKVFGTFDFHSYPPHKQTMSLTMEDRLLDLEELKKHISWQIDEEEIEDLFGHTYTELDIPCIHGVKDCRHWIKSMHMIGKWFLSMRFKTQEERFRERKILMTREMEEALLHNKEDKRPIEEKNVIAVYYLPSLLYTFTFQKEPYREWYIISGKQQEEGDWILYGLIYDREWKWGEIFLSELQNPRNPSFEKTKKRPDVFGRKLKDVLEEYGREGWESVLSEQLKSETHL